MWMDYFQGVVTEFLRADRSCFINPEFWLRGTLDKAKQYEKPHWYVDVLAVHMRLKQVFLCEVTYAKKAPALIARLKSWREHWPVILQTLREDTSLPSDWPVHPWLFAPKEVMVSLRPIAMELHPDPRFTELEDVVPWRYRTWDRHLDEAPEQLTISS
jgi:hypothetical protein